MKNKIPAAIILSIVAVVGGMALNFHEFLMGSPATIKNLLVTFTYIAIWIFILIMGIRSKNHGIMRYCSVFWMITLLLSILTWYANATEALVDWAIPYAILLLGQWYGIDFFVDSFLITAVIIASISLVMFTVTVISFKRTK